jgi:signal transduction histidine kinase
MAPILSQRFRSTVFDLCVALSVALMATLGLTIRTAPHVSSVPGYVMALALLFRRQRPLVTMGVVGAAALAQVVLFTGQHDPLPYDVAVLIAMYSAVKYGRRMLDAWLAAAVVATGIVIEVVRSGGAGWWAMALVYVAVCGGIWLVGYTVRARRIYVAGLEERAATLERERQHLARIAVADERAAIARELHDVVAHSLAVMIVQADGGRYAFETDPAKAREALGTVADTGRAALEDMRRLVGVLRGSGTGEPEPERHWATVEELDSLVGRARSAGLVVEMSTTGTPAGLSAAVELAVYRIVQEALTNVLRHAGRDAKVALSIAYGPEEELALSIVDDGGDHVDRPGHIEKSSGNGLVGMRERVAVHGGRFEAGPRLDGGWAVDVTIPLAEGAA